MPKLTTKQYVENGRAAAEFARSVRYLHRRRTERGDPQREADIQTALDRLRTAMKPLRSIIGGYTHAPQTEAAEEARKPVYEVSSEIQKERRKLWKMSTRSHAAE